MSSNTLISCFRRVAGVLSSSFLFGRARRLWELNSTDWNFHLSKWDKIGCGVYLILRDFAAGTFPPRFKDQDQAYQHEIDYNTSLPEMDLASVQAAHATKPFWNASASTKFLGDFNRVFSVLQKQGVLPGQRLLELGCGSGWMSELLAIAGYSVVGTTISHHDLTLANRKAAAHRCKELGSKLEFRACPMESLNEVAEFQRCFDSAYVYEALHHAYDWRKTLHAVASTLKQGGLLLIANEPNFLHTFISYRVAILSKTHEIGFARSELLKEMRDAGFEQIKVLQPVPDNWVSHFWVTARKR